MKRVITIAREFGSGGRHIGQLVAEKLGYKFYDKELILLMARESGLSDKFIEEAGEKVTSSFLFNVAMGGIYLNNSYNHNAMPLSDKIFVVQNKIINQLAEEGPCVIVGRCADYILKDRDDCLNVFIHSKMEDKIKRAVEFYNIAQKNAEKEIRKKDKSRASHYYYYTGIEWGKAENYDVTLNSGSLGIEACADAICNLAK